MFRYDTHVHTLPASRCAHASVRDTVEFYKEIGFDGIFITNHFLDGNLDMTADHPYEERLNFWAADYEEAVEIGKEVGLKIFLGAELSYQGTDFLVFGLDKAWFLAHPEIMDMKKSEELPYLQAHGALVVQAHPFLEANWIDHIRLYPRSVQGVEVYNANRSELVNRMAGIYADAYGLCKTAGTDNHCGSAQENLAGIETETPIVDEQDFIRRVLAGETRVFSMSVK